MNKSLFQKFITKTKKHKVELAVFLAILAVGVFFRAYNFSRWLHFEIDQVYDTTIVSNAVENGIGNLPLLGPTAGGGRALRLGPAFYYMEYLSAKIFGDNPVGYAMLILLSNIASLPLFYLFCKEFFSKKVSLSLLTIFSISFYSVMYSRFSWSPNVLPFLTLLSFYSLLRSVSEKETHKDRWFLLSVATIAITTQIHFNAFFSIPAIALVFLAIKRPRFKLTTWLAAFAIFAALYSPMIVSDIKTGGENIGFFISKLTKATKSGDQTFLETSSINIQRHSQAYFFIISGLGELDSKTIKAFSMFNGRSSDSILITNFFAILYLIGSIIFLASYLFIEKNKDKKSFLIICALWFIFTFTYFHSIVSGYRMYPRFFLVVSPLAVIFLGFLLSWIESKKNRLSFAIVVVLLVFLSFSNSSKVFAYFKLISAAESDYTGDLETEDVFPNVARITLKQEVDIASYISDIARSNGWPIFIASVSEYKPVFWYFLKKDGLKYYGEMSDEKTYRKANYFAIKEAGANPRINFDAYELVEKKSFGSIVVYRLSAKQPLIAPDAPDLASSILSDEEKKISELLTWNKLSLPYEHYDGK